MCNLYPVAAAPPHKARNKPVNYLAVDCESELISEEYGTMPPLVCVTVCDEEGDAELFTPWDDEDLEEILEAVLLDEDTTLVGANIAYDMGVIGRRYPGLIPAIATAYKADRIYDVQINERLNNLKRHGSVMTLPRPDGTTYQASYSLIDLELRYLNIDRSEEKSGTDIVRLRYNEMIGKPKADWPSDFTKYALDDARTPIEIMKLQTPHPQDFHRSRLSYALSHLTNEGLVVNEERVMALDAKVSKAMDTDNFPELVDLGILVPPMPAMPYANNAKAHVVGCTDKKYCSCPLKMTAPKKAKMSDKTLRVAVACESEEQGKSITLTDKGRETYYEITKRNERKLAFDNPWWTDYPNTVGKDKGTVASLAAGGSSLFRELVDYDEYKKLATTYIPSVVVETEDEIRIADRIRFPFNILVETGRTSSRTSKLFPSTNGQNADPRFRPCLEAEEGWAILSTDYAQLELRTLADFCYKQFGFSVARDMFIAGVDLHSFLGGQLAFSLDADFQAVCMESYDDGDKNGYYEAFLAMKTDNPKWFKHYRTFAKPVGLGYPGGLGAATLVEMAWSSYKFEMTKDLAEAAREVWLGTYPEMVLYFKHIREQCIDPNNTRTDKITKEAKKAYRYETPLGLTRVNCVYTAASNGLGMQSYAGDGAMLAIWAVFEACHNPALGSILLGCRPCDFIHDELLVKIPYDRDPTFANRAAAEIERLMCEAMMVVVTDVPITAESALSRCWNKWAEPKFDAAGTLIPDDPEPEEVAA